MSDKKTTGLKRLIVNWSDMLEEWADHLTGVEFVTRSEQYHAAAAMYGAAKAMRRAERAGR